ncbi:MAG: flagellar basal body L-ring protein FlgH [Sedimentisphaerales bacterium]|nr:flagellar basal body L-ring protein FlgH [Sedimentisphaerales bacterium]
MKLRTKNLVLMLTLISLAVTARGGSIWAQRNKKMKDVYADDVARNIGDVLTIKIVEDSTIDNKATRTLEKKTKRNAQFSGEIGLDHIIPSLPAVTLGTGTEYTNNLDGKADYKDERTFTDYITVVVIDVMPNGNLVVAGTRKREIAGDEQTIEISGIVRTEDISFDNIVESKSVANFQIVTKHGGDSASYTKPNWLGRIFDKIWLF